MPLHIIDSNLIRQHLSYPACIALVRDAMKSLSRGQPIHACDEQITVYKSLGHIVQDLSSAWFVYQAAMRHDEKCVAQF